MRFSIGRVAVAAAALAMLATPGVAQDTKKKAEAYPGKTPIELVALFGASSASTTTARELAKLMEKSLGTSIVIADKPGAGGAKGYIYLSTQKPDGYSLVWSSNSISTTFHNGQLPFDYKGLEHIARVTVENPALAVKADSPWKSLKELVEYAKANPGKVRVGNSGQGSQTHIASVALFTLAGAKVIPVHRTGGQATADLLAGRIEVAVQFPQAIVPHTKSGDGVQPTLRVLALLSSIPDPVFPNVKSAKSQGYNIDMPLWRGISAPKGTSKAVMTKLQAAIKKAVESPDFKEAGKKIGFTPAYQGMEAFNKSIAEDDKRTAQVIKAIKESEAEVKADPPKAEAAPKVEAPKAETPAEAPKAEAPPPADAPKAEQSK
jgi:tripartite-type tricarboxylate transporter receptor subunit TctC